MPCAIDKESVNMKEGLIVEHILSKDWLVFLGMQDDMLICRKKDMEIVYLYPFEVRERI